MARRALTLADYYLDYIYQGLRFEWDVAKSGLNAKKHGDPSDIGEKGDLSGSEELLNYWR